MSDINNGKLQVGGGKKNEYNNSGDVNTTNIHNYPFSNLFSKKLKNKTAKRVEELQQQINELKSTTEIEKLSELRDLNRIWDEILVSDDNVYEILKKNNILKESIEGSEEKKKEILNNIQFMNTAGIEEKTALIWCFMSDVNIDSNFKILREKYPFKKPYVSFGKSLNIFSNCGVSMQGNIIAVPPKNEILFTKVPELKQIFNFEWKSKENILGVKLTALAPQIKLLLLSLNWILEECEFWSTN